MLTKLAPCSLRCNIAPTAQAEPTALQAAEGRTYAPAKNAGAFYATSTSLTAYLWNIKKWVGCCAVAIYHLSAVRIGGNSGRSSVGAAAYHAGEKLRNENDGMLHDYTKRRNAISAAAYHSGNKLNNHDFTRKSEIIHSEIILPKNAPEKFADRATLWNSVETAKKQHNEQTSRMIVVALPNELTTEQQIKIVQDYVTRNFTDDGMCADFSLHLGHIHERKDENYPFEDLTIQKENPHAHIQLTTRPLNSDGTWANKAKREYILGKNGERIKTQDGKRWRSRNIQLTNWEKPETLIKWREDWAKTVNAEFERLGIDERIDHRTLAAQGIDREPTKHMGHRAWNLEKKGKKTIIGNQNRAIMAQNLARTPEAKAEFMHELKENYVIIDKEIVEIRAQIRGFEAERYDAQITADEITKRAERIKSLETSLDELKRERQKMDVFTRKKEVDEKIQAVERSRVRALDYFAKKYRIALSEAQTEIKKLGAKVAYFAHKIEPLQSRLTAFLEDRAVIKQEYQRQKVLMEVSRDCAKIRRKLEELEREMRGNRIDSERRRSVRVLDTVTERDFQEVLKALKPTQAAEVVRRREMRKERDLEMTL